MTKADELRREAAEHDARAEESFRRCDTDGFLSQWADGLTARKLRRDAEIEENGGADFLALFRDGELVSAKIIETRYGSRWGVFKTDDTFGEIVQWLPAYNVKALAKKGFTLGRVMVGKDKVYADYAGSGRGLSGAASVYVTTKRRDGGFSRDVEVLTTDIRDEDDYDATIWED